MYAARASARQQALRSSSAPDVLRDGHLSRRHAVARELAHDETAGIIETQVGLVLDEEAGNSWLRSHFIYLLFCQPRCAPLLQAGAGLLKAWSWAALSLVKWLGRWRAWLEHGGRGQLGCSKRGRETGGRLALLTKHAAATARP